MMKLQIWQSKEFWLFINALRRAVLLIFCLLYNNNKSNLIFMVAFYKLLSDLKKLQLLNNF